MTPQICQFGYSDWIRYVFAVLILLPAAVWPKPLWASECEIVTDEYTIYETILTAMTPVDEADLYFKSEDSSYVMPRLKLLVVNTPHGVDTSSFQGISRRAIPDSVPVAAKDQMIHDLLAKSECTSPIKDCFSALVPVRVVTENEIAEVVGDEDYGYWQSMRDYYGPCGIVDFSRVGFSDDGQYAILYYGYVTGSLSGAGYTVIMAKSADRWKILKMSMMWIS